MVAQIAEAYVEKAVELKLNNKVSIHGKLSGLVYNENKTLAYIQTAGATQIKFQGEVIPGQDVDVHNMGYGMPVGAIQGFKKSWYTKKNFEAMDFKVGQKKKIVYESGVVIQGTIKKLSFDEQGNLLVVTYSDATVKNGDNFLFRKEWGDFDVAVADFIEEVQIQK